MRFRLLQIPQKELYLCQIKTHKILHNGSG